MVPFNINVNTLQFGVYLGWCRDTQHIGTEDNDTQHNDTQHNDTQHNDIKHNDI
jgi:hypothetical protein